MLGGFEVIDVHHHVGDPSAVFGAMPLSGQGAPDAGGQAGQVDEMAKRLEVMEAGGVDRSVVIPGHLPTSRFSRATASPSAIALSFIRRSMDFVSVCFKRPLCYNLNYS